MDALHPDPAGLGHLCADVLGTATEPDAVRRRARHGRLGGRAAQRHRSRRRAGTPPAGAGSCAAGRAGPPAPPRRTRSRRPRRRTRSRRPRPPGRARRRPPGTTRRRRQSPASTSLSYLPIVGTVVAGSGFPAAPRRRRAGVPGARRSTHEGAAKVSSVRGAVFARSQRTVCGGAQSGDHASDVLDGSETATARSTYPCLHVPRSGRGDPGPAPVEPGSSPGYAPGAPAWCPTTRSPTRSPATRSTSSPTHPARGPTSRCAQGIAALSKLSPGRDPAGAARPRRPARAARPRPVHRRGAGGRRGGRRPRARADPGGAQRTPRVRG